MLPFDKYPEKGLHKLECNIGGTNCRREYGLHIQQITNQTRCAYCDISLVDDYYHWLLLSVDHVISIKLAKSLGIDLSFWDDVINKVLCCTGCNGFRNRYNIPNHWPFQRHEHWTDEEFVELRDEVFKDRKKLIAERRADEMNFFDQKRWTLPYVQKKSRISQLIKGVEAK